MFLCALGVSLLGCLSASAQDSSISARNFLRINEEYCTGGQPSVEDMARLSTQGVRAILNLRRPSESPLWKEIREQAQKNGLSYFNIPVDSSNLKEEQVDEFLDIVGDAENRPIFIHCASANRVGGFWLIYRVLMHNWSFDQAEAEARKVGLRSSALIDFARRYIEAHR